MKLWRLLVLGAFALICLAPNAKAQSWAKFYDGPAKGDDQAVCIATDTTNNVFVAGASQGASGDIVVIKYSATGTRLWAKRYDGAAKNDDYPTAIAVDATGNVIVVGNSRGKTSGYDWVVIKYDTNGNRLWVQVQDGGTSNDDYAACIALDSNNNLLVGGNLYLKDPSYTSMAVIKYDTNGNKKWQKTVHGSGNYSYDTANSIAVDGNNNVVITGRTYSSDNTYDCATIKFDADGNRLWGQRYDSQKRYDEGKTVLVDSSGNVFVAGTSGDEPHNDYYNTKADFVTIKYDSLGTRQWAMRYDGVGKGNDSLVGMGKDAAGNVYVAGTSYAVNSYLDFVVIKYDTSGKQQWLQSFNGAGNDDDYLSGIVVDSSGNVVVTGTSYSGRYYQNEAVAVKFDTKGVRKWVKRYNYPNNTYLAREDNGYAVTIDSTGAVIMVGRAYNEQSSYDLFVARYAP